MLISTCILKGKSKRLYAKEDGQKLDGNIKYIFTIIVCEGNKDFLLK